MHFKKADCMLKALGSCEVETQQMWQRQLCLQVIHHPSLPTWNVETCIFSAMSMMKLGRYHATHLYASCGLIAAGLWGGKFFSPAACLRISCFVTPKSLAWSPALYMKWFISWTQTVWINYTTNKVGKLNDKGTEIQIVKAADLFKVLLCIKKNQHDRANWPIFYWMPIELSGHRLYSVEHYILPLNCTTAFQLPPQALYSFIGLSTFCAHFQKLCFQFTMYDAEVYI